MPIRIFILALLLSGCAQEMQNQKATQATDTAAQAKFTGKKLSVEEIKQLYANNAILDLKINNRSMFRLTISDSKVFGVSDESLAYPKKHDGHLSWNNDQFCLKFGFIKPHVVWAMLNGCYDFIETEDKSYILREDGKVFAEVTIR